MSFGSRSKWCDFTPASICEEYVDVTAFVFHDGIEPVQILKARYITRDRRDVSSDKGCSLFQFFLPSASNHDMRALFHEALGRRQANPAVTTRDDCNLTFKLSHKHSLR